MAATNSFLYLGRRAMVVGATSGIGEGIALRLAELGFSVTAVGRSVERGEAVVAKMTALSAGHSVAPHRFQQCDGSLIRNMNALAAELSAEPLQLDLLVITQGIASVDGRTETAERIDLKLATHYYARIALILGLLPALRNSVPSSGEPPSSGTPSDVTPAANQIASPSTNQASDDPSFSSSSSHSSSSSYSSSSTFPSSVYWPGGIVLSVLAPGVHPPYKHYRDDPGLVHNYSVKLAADAATMYNDIAMDSLARENPMVRFIHANPGFVNTNWGTEMPWYIRWPVRVFQPFGKSPQDCARTLTTAMFRSYPSNFLLVDDKGGLTRTTSLHEEAREFVWEHTLSTIRSAPEVPSPQVDQVCED